MTKLEQLIEQHCPDGVEYKTLGQCTIKTEKIKWSEHQNIDFQYIDLTSVDRVKHIIVETQKINSENPPSRAQQIVEYMDILFGTTRPTLMRYCFIPEQLDNQICSTGFCVLRANNKIVMKEWLYHNISSSKLYTYVERTQKGASYPAISDKEVKQFRIPVPPLEVQAEIVRILDKFTELTTELTTELATELANRKKQYEYYREKFLRFDPTVDKSQIGDLCNIIVGGDVPKEHYSKEKSDTFSVPIISNGIGKNAIYGYTKKVKVNQSAVTIAARGTIGYAEFRDYPYYPIIRLLSVIPKNNSIINTKYLYYCLQGRKYKVPKTGIPQLTVPMLKKEKICVPTLETQNHIVSVLDRFDKLCNDISEGLPAEIEARQKQYEYYRDKLLTFIMKE